jgi:tryptophanyl-tRNA synthetase
MKCPVCKKLTKFIVEFEYNKPTKSYFRCKSNCYQKFEQFIAEYRKQDAEIKERIEEDLITA